MTRHHRLDLVIPILLVGIPILTILLVHSVESRTTPQGPPAHARGKPTVEQQADPDAYWTP